jgi:Tetracyclin repressor-like, C-terminal domain
VGRSPTWAAMAAAMSALRLVENLLGILLAGGLDPQDAAWAADIFSLLVTYAAIEHEARRAGDEELADEVHRTFAGLPPDRFPLLTAHATQLVAGTSDERFRYAVDVVTDGLLARAARR